MILNKITKAIHARVAEEKQKIWADFCSMDWVSDYVFGVLTGAKNE